jgi:hypothetical protein
LFTPQSDFIAQGVKEDYAVTRSFAAHDGARRRARRHAAFIVLAAMLGVALNGCHDAAAPTMQATREPLASAFDSDAGNGVAIASSHWLNLPSLSLARGDLAAVTFSSCVWTIGGSFTGTNASDKVERFCPSVSNSWTPGPSLPEPLARFAGVGVIATKIYVAGGTDSNGQARNTLYIYDVANGWRLSPEPLPFPMACGAAAVSGGKLYAYGWKPVGVQDPNEPPNCSYDFEPVFVVYDPASPRPRWRVLPSEPPDQWGNPVTRCFHSLAITGGIVYVLGGLARCDFYYNHVLAAAFSTTTGQWLPSGQIAEPYDVHPEDGRYGQATLALNGRLFAFGGYNQNIPWFPGAEVLVYEPAVNAWDQLPDMPFDRMHVGATSLGNRLIVTGGYGANLGYHPQGSAAQLHVSPGCDVHEPDGTVARANPWVLQSDLAGGPLPPYTMSLARVCSVNDVDNFLVTPRFGPDIFQIVLTPPAGKDYQLELLDATGTIVLAQSAQPGSVPETVTTPGGFVQYLLRIKGQNGSFDSLRPYQLNVP